MSVHCWYYRYLYQHSSQQIYNCDGIPFCQQTTINCNSGENCEVNCYYNPGDRRRLLNTFKSIQSNSRSLLYTTECPSSLYGCCESTINCPSGYDCDIDCDRGCHGIIINAQDSTSLIIRNCDSGSGIYYCTNMKIYCPIDGRGGSTDACYFSSSDEIIDSNIYTQEGFRDIYFGSTTVVCLWLLLYVFISSENVFYI